MSAFIIAWTFSSSLFFLVPAIIFRLGFIDVSARSVSIILVLHWILLGLIQWLILKPYISNARTWCLVNMIGGSIMSCLLTAIIAFSTFVYSTIASYGSNIDNLDVGYLVILTSFVFSLIFGFLLGWKQKSILKTSRISNQLYLIPIATSLSWLLNISMLIVAFASSEQKGLENYQAHIWSIVVFCTFFSNLIKALVIQTILNCKSNKLIKQADLQYQFKSNFNLSKVKMSNFVLLWTLSLYLFFFVPAIIYIFSSVEGSIKSMSIILIVDWILLGLIQWQILKSYIPNAYIWSLITTFSGIVISYIWTIGVFYGWMVIGITSFTDKNYSILKSLILLANIALFFGLGYLFGQIQLSVLGKLIVLHRTSHFLRNTGLYWLLNIPVSLIASMVISYKRTPWYAILLAIVISAVLVITSSLKYSSKLEQILIN